jgi:hypothetical protein
VPFVFSANGRAYLKQIETESGIWFRDVRRPANLRRALVEWVTPQGLKDLLEALGVRLPDTMTQRGPRGFCARNQVRRGLFAGGGSQVRTRLGRPDRLRPLKAGFIAGLMNS